MPAGGGEPAVAGVVVRSAIGTFGIDILMDQPAPIGYEETMTTAADWWSASSLSVVRHEIGHLLGLVLWSAETGLVTADRKHFVGPRAVEAYRTGGGDASLPGVPIQASGKGSHWSGAYDCDALGLPCVKDELMNPDGGIKMMDAVSVAALADAGYTVDMTKATPWRRPDA